MIYVELKAQKGDGWANGIGRYDQPLQADRRLTHMPTSEANPLSYAPFSEVQRILLDNWSIFSGYLPPQDIWQAKLGEISQIRHRVAHFRRGHADDLDRVVQLLRDLDKGFWEFCTSYNNSMPFLPPSSDPVADRFSNYDPFPFHQMENGIWAQSGSADPAMPFVVVMRFLRRPWAQLTSKVDGTPGYLYDVSIVARDERLFDYRKYLAASLGIQTSIVHVCLDHFANATRITIPAVLGAPRVEQIVARAIEVTEYNIRRGQNYGVEDDQVQRLSEDYPEHILGPTNPLTFLDPDMPCSFFNA